MGIGGDDVGFAFGREVAKVSPWKRSDGAGVTIRLVEVGAGFFGLAVFTDAGMANASNGVVAGDWGMFFGRL